MSDALLSASSPLLRAAAPPPPYPPPSPLPFLQRSLIIRPLRRLRRVKPTASSISTAGGSVAPARRSRAASVWRGVEAVTPAGRKAGDGVDAPTSIELVPIASEEKFDRIIAEAQQLEESLVVLWMANWCRKCIYLKPKLEKLAAEYYPRIRFYCIDVNTVPQRLVNRAGITKMPTIQWWKDSQKQAEVIGGHNKAWLVVDEVRRMIESEE